MIRYATESDVRDWYGAVPFTSRAIVVEEDGEVIGIAGIATGRGYPQLWSELKPAIRERRMTMARAAAKLRGMLDEYRTVVAVCDPKEPTSPRLLDWLGFEPWDGATWRRFGGD